MIKQIHVFISLSGQQHNEQIIQREHEETAWTAFC